MRRVEAPLRGDLPRKGRHHLVDVDRLRQMRVHPGFFSEARTSSANALADMATMGMSRAAESSSARIARASRRNPFITASLTSHQHGVGSSRPRPRAARAPPLAAHAQSPSCRALQQLAGYLGVELVVLDEARAPQDVAARLFIRRRCRVADRPLPRASPQRFERRDGS